MLACIVCCLLHITNTCVCVCCDVSSFSKHRFCFSQLTHTFIISFLFAWTWNTWLLAKTRSVSVATAFFPCLIRKNQTRIILTQNTRWTHTCTPLRWEKILPRVCLCVCGCALQQHSRGVMRLCVGVCFLKWPVCSFLFGLRVCP